MITVLLCAFGFRVRGGLLIKGKKLPLNKWWFAIIFALCSCYIYKGDWNLFWVVFIATRLSTQLAGWGEYCGCALGIGKPNPERSDFAEADEFLDNLNYNGFKLIDYPILFGILGLTLRGIYLTFIIGLSLCNIPYMLCGALMGIIYYLCGLFARKVLKKNDKTGWNIAEWIFGGYLGLCLYL